MAKQHFNRASVMYPSFWHPDTEAPLTASISFGAIDSQAQLERLAGMISPLVTIEPLPELEIFAVSPAEVAGVQVAAAHHKIPVRDGILGSFMKAWPGHRMQETGILRPARPFLIDNPRDPGEDSKILAYTMNAVERKNPPVATSIRSRFRKLVLEALRPEVDAREISTLRAVPPFMPVARVPRPQDVIAAGERIGGNCLNFEPLAIGKMVMVCHNKNT